VAVGGVNFKLDLTGKELDEKMSNKNCARWKVDDGEHENIDVGRDPIEQEIMDNRKKAIDPDLFRDLRNGVKLTLGGINVVPDMKNFIGNLVITSRAELVLSRTGEE
jgi:hypothetical protein